jgi:transposase
MSDGFFTSAVADDDYQPPVIDTSVAHQARVYDYWLGGKDNFAADREVGDKAIQASPDLPAVARANRAFLGRAVRFLAGEAGIRQFLDIGTGGAPRLPWRVRPQGRMLGMGSGMKHPPELRERAVQMVFDLRKESGTDRGAIVRVAERLGVNSETLRGWLKTAEIDSGKRAGTTSDDKKRIAELERELREANRAIEILKAASTYFARELGPQLPR